MLSKIENLTINTEESLNNFIQFLENIDNLRFCSLRFTINDLPSEKLNNLAELLRKQTKLDTLVLTAQVSSGSSELYASILEKVFADLRHLISLTFRGLFSENTVKTLTNLIKTTKTLSMLSVGACYAGHYCSVIPEQSSKCFANALEQNATLTHLNLSRNALKESGVATIINSLGINIPLKILDLSGNISPGKYKNSYSGEGIKDLLGRHKDLEKIHTNGFYMTHLESAFTLNINEQFTLACVCLTRFSTVKHLELTLNAVNASTKSFNLLALTINNLLHLQKLKIYGLSSQGFQILCQQSLTKPTALTNLALMDVSDLTEESALGLIELITSNTHLTSLIFCPKYLVDCNWPGNFLPAKLGESLGQNLNLIHFKLEGTKINDPEIIAKIAANNQRLQVLDLENNGFSYDVNGVNLILDSLSTNKTLLTLNLCSNHLQFPTTLNPKFHLTDFQILRYPSALEQGEYYSDFNLENKIRPEIYRFIKEKQEDNKKWRLIQKYLLLNYIGIQTHYLNKDLINFIFLCTLESFELKTIDKAIRKTKEISTNQNILESASYPTPSKSNCHPFLLQLGASLAVRAGTNTRIIGLLALLGVINLSGIGLPLTTGCLCVGLGIFGFFKDKQDKAPVSNVGCLLPRAT